MKLEPLEDFVVIAPSEAEKVSRGGIHLPETGQQQQTQRGRVIAVGPGRRGEDGGVIACVLRKGDEVIHARYGGSEIEIEGSRIRIMRESEVLARVT